MIKRASWDDFEVFWQLLLEFFRELREKQGWRPPDEEEVKGWAREALERDVVFLAEEDGRPVGFARLGLVEGAWYVKEVYVRPEERGKGWGRRLVRACEEEVLKNGEVSLYLLALPQDLDALRFWVKEGYDVLNSLELAKDLRPTGREKGERLNFKGLELRLWKWRKQGL